MSQETPKLRQARQSLCRLRWLGETGRGPGARDQQKPGRGRPLMHTESQREEGQKLLLHFSRLPPNHGKESRSNVIRMCTNLFIQQTLGAHCVAGVVVSATGNLAVNDTVSTMMLLALKIPNLSPAPNTPPCDLVAAAPPVCASQGLSQDLEGSDCGSHQSPRWGQDFCWRIQERGREPMSRVLMWEAGGEARGAARTPATCPRTRSCGPTRTARLGKKASSQ